MKPDCQAGEIFFLSHAVLCVEHTFHPKCVLQGKGKEKERNGKRIG